MSEDLIEEYSSDIPQEHDEYTEEDLFQDLQYPNARNVVINQFSDFTEITLYKKAFFVNPNLNKQDIDRRRKFKYDENEVLQIARDDVTFNDLLDVNNRSRRRTLDNFFGYALTNDWDYFVTLTFDSKKVDRTKKSEINNAWKNFRERLQYRFPNIKILVVTEEHHTDGCLHFHGFIGNADLSPYLTMAINNMKYLNTYDYVTRKKVYKLDLEGNPIPNKYYGCLLKTSFGDQIYNFDKKIYDLGFTTVVKLHEENEPGDNNKIVMYMAKYMRKNYNSVEYNKKSYYRTYNLDFKKKIVTKSMDSTTGEILDILSDKDKVVKKENDKMTVFIIKGNDLEYTFDTPTPVINSKASNNVVYCKDNTQLSIDDMASKKIFKDDPYTTKCIKDNVSVKPGTTEFNTVNTLFPSDSDLLDIFD